MKGRTQALDLPDDPWYLQAVTEFTGHCFPVSKTVVDAGEGLVTRLTSNPCPHHPRGLSTSACHGGETLDASRPLFVRWGQCWASLRGTYLEGAELGPCNEKHSKLVGTCAVFLLNVLKRDPVSFMSLSQPKSQCLFLPCPSFPAPSVSDTRGGKVVHLRMLA